MTREEARNTLLTSLDSAYELTHNDKSDYNAVLDGDFEYHIYHSDYEALIALGVILRQGRAK